MTCPSCLYAELTPFGNYHLCPQCGWSTKGDRPPRWSPLIASDGELTTPLFKGRVVVEDVKEDRFTTTVVLRSLPTGRDAG